MLETLLFFMANILADGDASEGWPIEVPHIHSGLRQSPINILQNEALIMQLPPLIFKCSNWDGKVNVTNNGHGLKVSLDDEASSRFMLFGGPLSDDYVFNNFHFHWGNTGESGSEHAIDGKKFDGEAHAVYYTWEAKDIKKTSDYTEGIAVIAFFLKECPSSSEPVTTIMKLAKNLTEPGSKAEMDATLAMNWQHELHKTQNFYFTYLGSLTTEPFTENVVFIVFPNPLSITHDELSTLRCLKSFRGIPILRNWRKLQTKNERHVIMVEQFKKLVDEK